MADQEVSIIIRAIDEMSATLKKIEGTLEKSSKNIQKTTANTSQSFDKQMGSVLVLGQAVNSVNNIMDTYQNTQLRLENASERVIGSQENLKKAQLRLLKVQKNASATAEDLADAQLDIEASTRSLTIANNNLQRAQNKVFDSYLQIGMQVAVLISTIPTLIASFKALAVAIGLSTGGLSLLIGALVTFGYFVVTEMGKAKKETDNYTDSLNNMNIAFRESKDQVSIFKEALDGILGSQRATIEGAVLPGEISKQQEIIDLEKNRADKLQQLTDIKSSYAYSNINLDSAESISANRLAQAQANAIESEISSIERKIKTKQKEYDNTIGLQKSLISKQLELNGELKKTETPFDILWNKVRNFRDELNLAIKDIESARLQKALEKLKDFIETSKKASTAGKGGSLYESAGAPTGMGGKGTISIAPTFKLPTNFTQPAFHDFISRPGQAPVSFSSSDTIVGTKEGIGTTIIINGDNYGVNADAIARSLQDKLYRRISI